MFYQLQKKENVCEQENRPPVQGWHSGDSPHLPPMWPGFDSQIRHQMRVEFVGSLLHTERFSPGASVSPPLKKTKI